MKLNVLREIETQSQEKWKNEKIFEEDAPQVTPHLNQLTKFADVGRILFLQLFICCACMQTKVF